MNQDAQEAAIMGLLSLSPTNNVPPHPLPPPTNSTSTVPLKRKHLDGGGVPHQGVGVKRRTTSTPSYNNNQQQQHQYQHQQPQPPPVHPHSHLQHQNQPPQQQQPPPPPNEGDISSEPISCVCGFTHDDGFSIACDDCGRWCHAACFGIIWGEVPQNWSCWQCAPSQHPRLPRPGFSAFYAAGYEHPGQGMGVVPGHGHGRRRASPGMERKGQQQRGHGQGRIVISTGDMPSMQPPPGPFMTPTSATTSASANTAGGKRKRRTSFAVPDPHVHAHTIDGATATAINANNGENTIVDVDSAPWSQTYISLTEDTVPDPHLRAKLTQPGNGWRGITFLDHPPPQDDSSDDYDSSFNYRHHHHHSNHHHHHQSTLHSYPPSLHPNHPHPISIHALPTPHPSPRPPTYSVLTTTPIPSNSLIAPYTSTITPSSTYLRDPLNAYAHLGLPKPFVHLLGPPLDLALDARIAGGEARYVRSGCRPNAVLRPVFCKGASDKFKCGSGKGKEKEKEGVNEGEGEPVAEQEEKEGTLTFAVFALRDLKANEEVVLGWEWDDGHVVHKLPALIKSPGLFPPAHHHHLRAQLTNLLHLLTSTFASCACGAQARDCALRQMERFVEGRPFDVPMTLRPSADEREREVEVDLGPLVGRTRGFRTRERVRGAGGMVGMEMVPPGEEEVVTRGRRGREKERDREGESGGRRTRRSERQRAKARREAGEDVDVDVVGDGDVLMTSPSKKKQAPEDEVDADATEDEMDVAARGRSRGRGHPRSTHELRPPDPGPSSRVHSPSISFLVSPPSPTVEQAQELELEETEERQPPKMRKKWRKAEAEAFRKGGAVDSGSTAEAADTWGRFGPTGRTEGADVEMGDSGTTKAQDEDEKTVAGGVVEEERMDVEVEVEHLKPPPDPRPTTPPLAQHTPRSLHALLNPSPSSKLTSLSSSPSTSPKPQPQPELESQQPPTRIHSREPTPPPLSLPPSSPSEPTHTPSPAQQATPLPPIAPYLEAVAPLQPLQVTRLQSKSQSPVPQAIASASSTTSGSSTASPTASFARLSLMSPVVTQASGFRAVHAISGGSGGGFAGAGGVDVLGNGNGSGIGRGRRRSMVQVKHMEAPVEVEEEPVMSIPARAPVLAEAVVEAVGQQAVEVMEEAPPCVQVAAPVAVPKLELELPQQEPEPKPEPEIQPEVEPQPAEVETMEREPEQAQPAIVLDEDVEMDGTHSPRTEPVPEPTSEAEPSPLSSMDVQKEGVITLSETPPLRVSTDLPTSPSPLPVEGPPLSSALDVLADAAASSVSPPPPSPPPFSALDVLADAAASVPSSPLLSKAPLSPLYVLADAAVSSKLSVSDAVMVEEITPAVDDDMVVDVLLVATDGSVPLVSESSVPMVVEEVEVAVPVPLSATDPVDVSPSPSTTRLPTLPPPSSEAAELQTTSATARSPTPPPIHIRTPTPPPTLLMPEPEPTQTSATLPLQPQKVKISYKDYKLRKQKQKEEEEKEKSKVVVESGGSLSVDVVVNGGGSGSASSVEASPVVSSIPLAAEASEKERNQETSAAKDEHAMEVTRDTKRTEKVEVIVNGIKPISTLTVTPSLPQPTPPPPSKSPSPVTTVAKDEDVVMADALPSPAVDPPAPLPVPPPRAPTPVKQPLNQIQRTELPRRPIPVTQALVAKFAPPILTTVPVAKSKPSAPVISPHVKLAGHLPKKPPPPSKPLPAPSHGVLAQPLTLQAKKELVDPPLFSPSVSSSSSSLAREPSKNTTTNGILPRVNGDISSHSNSTSTSIPMPSSRQNSTPVSSSRPTATSSRPLSERIGPLASPSHIFGSSPQKDPSPPPLPPPTTIPPKSFSFPPAPVLAHSRTPGLHSFSQEDGEISLGDDATPSPQPAPRRQRVSNPPQPPPPQPSTTPAPLPAPRPPPSSISPPRGPRALVGGTRQPPPHLRVPSSTSSTSTSSSTAGGALTTPSAAAMGAPAVYQPVQKAPPTGPRSLRMAGNLNMNANQFYQSPTMHMARVPRGMAGMGMGMGAMRRPSVDREREGSATPSAPDADDTRRGYLPPRGPSSDREKEKGNEVERERWGGRRESTASSGGGWGR